MDASPIRTPDHRIRVFVSSTLRELEPERAAVRAAIERLRLAPVMFELGARPHPPRSLYRAYLAQSDVFLGLYWQQYGWTAPGEEVSGLEDEYLLSGALPSLIYLKEPAPDRDPRLAEMLARIRADDRTSYKSFRTPEELAELVVDDLATLLADRFDHVAAQSHTPPALSGGRIPAAYTAMIGRDEELDSLARMVADPDVRLVNIVGPGGVGKSRLALALAADLAAAARPVFFVSLEGATSPRAVLPTIAATLGVRDDSAMPLEEAVLAALAGRGAVLVIDNMEHVLDAGGLLVRMLTGEPSLTMLVTSRSPLRLRAEHVFALPPLPVPAADDGFTAAARVPAVELFVARARAAQPQFELTRENAAAVAEISRAVDGVPLAIELAAAQVRTHTPEEVRARLGSALTVLAGGARDLPERQRTIRDTVEWSVRLLDEPTCAALAALSVFAGPFDREAAEAVLAGIDGVDPAAAIDALVDASLLQQQEQDGMRMFRLLGVVRAFAAELPPIEGTQEAWIQYYLAWARRAEHGMQSRQQARWLRRAEVERPNLAAIMRVLLDQRRYRDAADFGRALYLYVWLAGRLGIMHAWMTELLRVAEREGRELDPRTEATARYYANAIDFWQHLGTDVVPGLRRSAALYDEVDDAAGAGMARINLGLALVSQPDGPDAAAAAAELDTAVRQFRRIDDVWGEAMALVTLGRLDLVIGDIPAAQEHIERSVALAETQDEQVAIVIARNHRGWARYAVGDIEGAEDDFAMGLDSSLALGHDEGVAYGLEGLAGVAAVRGDAERTGLLLGAAEMLRRRHGIVNTAQFAPYAPAVQAMREAGAGPVLDAAYARGRVSEVREVLDALHG